MRSRCVEELLFADDFFLFSRANESKTSIIKDILDTYGKAPTLFSESN